MIYLILLLVAGIGLLTVVAAGVVRHRAQGKGSIAVSRADLLATFTLAVLVDPRRAVRVTDHAWTPPRRAVPPRGLSTNLAALVLSLCFAAAVIMLAIGIPGRAGKALLLGRRGPVTIPTVGIFVRPRHSKAR